MVHWDVLCEAAGLSWMQKLIPIVESERSVVIAGIAGIAYIGASCPMATTVTGMFGAIISAGFIFGLVGISFVAASQKHASTTVEQKAPEP